MTAPVSRPWRVAVVGAGISGLAAAQRLVELCSENRRPCDLTVFEAGSRVGGSIETRRIGEYLVETGADSFITNKPWAVSLCQRLGLEDQLIATDERFRRSLVLRKGRPLPVPEGFMLLAPAKVWPVLCSPIFSPWGKLRMGLELFVPRRMQDDDESLADFVRRRFGREAFERVVQPLVGGIYTSDPEKLSLRATMPRFIEMEREHGSLIRASRRERSAALAAESQGSGARYGLFATLREGLSQLVAALERSIAASASLRLNTPVRSLRMVAEAAPFQLLLESGEDASFDAVILALPAFRAAELVAELPAPGARSFVGHVSNVPALLEKSSTLETCSTSELLRRIEYASTAIVVSGHKTSAVRDPLNAFGLVVPMIEKRDILAVSFASRKFPGRAPDDRVLLRTFVGGATQPELCELSDDQIIGRVQRELKQILGVSGDADFVTVARHSRAMPQYHTGHVELAAAIERAASNFPGLALAGNSLHGVGIPDCILSGEQAAAAVFAGFPRRMADQSPA